MIMVMIRMVIIIMIRKGRDRLSEMGDFLYKVPIFDFDFDFNHTQNNIRLRSFIISLHYFCRRFLVQDSTLPTYNVNEKIK